MQSLAEGEIRRNAFEAAENFGGDYGEVFYQHDFSGEVQARAGDFPAIVSDLFLLNDEAAAAVEMAEDSPTETDGLEERAVNARQTLTIGVEEHVALHSREHFFHAGGRPVTRIRSELQFDQRSADPADTL